MNFKESFTPKDTEELKPGLFIQKKGDTYRQINPVVWNNEWRLKNQFGWRNLFTIAIILFIAWSYFNDTQWCRDFMEDPCEVLPNVTQYCRLRSEANSFVDFEVNNGKTNTLSIQSPS